MAEQSCLDMVRAGDKDMFLATLFAPEAAQPHLFALHAFAIEVARIPHLVSEAQKVEEALKELFLQPLHYPFKQLVNAGLFRRLIATAAG